LKKNGRLIIDTLPASTLPLGMKKNDNKTIYAQEINNATIHTYSASKEQMEHYAYLAEFSDIEHIDYFTDTERQRMFHVMS